MSNVETYFTKGKIVAESGDVKVYLMQGQLFLEIGPGHDLWALESEDFDYINQLRKQNGSRVILWDDKIYQLALLSVRKNQLSCFVEFHA